MYRKDSTGWIKHVDFIILDLICLQVAFVLAYALSGYGANPYQLILYRNMAVFMEVADLVVLFAMGTLKNVLKRGYYKDFVVTAVSYTHLFCDCDELFNQTGCDWIFDLYCGQYVY